MTSILPQWLSKRQKVLVLAAAIYVVYIYQVHMFLAIAFLFCSRSLFLFFFFFFCFFFVTYICTKGILFEDLHNAPVGVTELGEPIRWGFPEGILLFTISGNILVAAALIWFTSPPPNRVEQLKFALLSVPMFIAGGCTYMSMSKLDYPTLSLFKSAKPLAILVVAVVSCRDHVYSMRQKVMVVFVSAGLALFFFFKEASVISNNLDGGFSWSTRGVGYAGILAALACDGFAALIATHICRGVNPPSAYHMQLFMNLWSFCVVLSYAVVVKQLSFVAFLVEYPRVLAKLGWIAALSGVGQLFIFATITTFDPLVLSVLTTTRKVFTIIFSAVMFNHSLTAMQWFAVALLFTGLLYYDVYELLVSYLAPTNTTTTTSENFL
jgi:UDP-galactose transporter B1